MKSKISLFGLVGLSLLLGACGQQAAQPVQSDLPFVPVAQRPAQPDCGTDAGASAARLVGLRNLAGENRIPLSRLMAQSDLPGNLQDLLYSTRSLINNYYYGFSTVDLQAVHAQYLAEFKKTHPSSLANYPVDAQVDELMAKYIDAFQDEHTFYRDYDQTQAYHAGSTGTPTPTPIFGVSYDVVPGADGVVILSVRGDGPFYAAGLRRGDVLLEVDGQALKRLPADAGSDSDTTTYLAARKILSDAAKKGSAVSVKYRRAGQVAEVSVQAKILSSTQLPYGELIAGTKHYYLRFPTFSGDGIVDRVHALVTDAKAKGATDIIVDLRDNGGGLLVNFVGAAGAFSPDTAGEVAEDITANDATFKYDAAQGAVVAYDVCRTGELNIPVAKPDHWTGRVVILTNHYSASASELFSEALRLGGQTTIVGETTYGVGNTFTYAFDLPADRNMSVTSGRSKLLNGQYATQDVTPDLPAADDLSALAAGNDLALQAALNVLK